MIAKPPSAASRILTSSLLIGCALVQFAAAYYVVNSVRFEHRLSEQFSYMHGEATYAQVCELMKEGGKFRYDGTDHLIPQSPEVTEARRAGDCKDLALWLAARMSDPAVMFVAGHFDFSREHHVWLEWYGEGQLWILDLTAKFNGSAPMLASESHDPASDFYYVPERIVTRYGVFTSNGSISAEPPIGGCSHPAEVR